MYKMPNTLGYLASTPRNEKAMEKLCGLLKVKNRDPSTQFLVNTSFIIHR